MKVQWNFLVHFIYGQEEKKLYIKIFYFQSIFTPFLIATNLSWTEKDFTHDKISFNNKEICNYLKQN